MWTILWRNIRVESSMTPWILYLIEREYVERETFESNHLGMISLKK